MWKRTTLPDKQEPLVHSHDSPVTVTIDTIAWREGMERAKGGGSTFDNPYPLGSDAAYSWLSGFIGYKDNASEGQEYGSRKKESGP